MTKTFDTLKYTVKLIRPPLKSKSENWEETAYEWHVEFITDNGWFSFPYFTGSGLVDHKHGRDIPRKPTVKDLVHSLYIDSMACNQSFNDWCSDYGYSSDSMKAFKTYQACCESGVKLRKLGLSSEYLETEFADY